ncbi:MAG TPA: DUF1573 domain-containing protein [Verrucomicrobiae bacterium]
MKFRRIFSCTLAGIIFSAACVQHRAGTSAAPAPAKPIVRSPPVATTPPVYVPDISHASRELPDGILAWDALSKATNVNSGEAQAHFTFGFTNVSGGNVTILNVKPSCGCTTAQLPPTPWLLPPGTNGEIKLSVNLEGKSGTLFKSLGVTTDQGIKRLMMRIDILPPVVRKLTDAEREQQMAIAKVDRQAVFHGDCATCHIPKNAEARYGQELYAAVCGICHEAEHRATMVPDLHNLKVPTNDQFWQTWIAHGKPGSLMPAFSHAEGGPLNDMQIASLAAYLNAAIPSRVAPASQ